MALVGQTLTTTFDVYTATAPISLVDADGNAITAVVRRNGLVVSGAAVTITHVGTGVYTLAYALSSADGWVAGDSYAVNVSYAVSGTQLGQVPMTGTVDGYQTPGTTYGRWAPCASLGFAYTGHGQPAGGGAPANIVPGDGTMGYTVWDYALNEVLSYRRTGVYELPTLNQQGQVDGGYAIQGGITLPNGSYIIGWGLAANQWLAFETLDPSNVIALSPTAVTGVAAVAAATVGTIDWTIYRGTLFTADIVFSVDISGVGTHIWVTAKHKLNDADSAKVFQKTEVSGITITGPQTARLTLSAADTAALTDIRTKLHVDVKVQLSGQDPQEVAVGTAIVLQGTTRAPGT